MINIKSCCRFLIIFISLIVEIAAEDGDFFLSSFDAGKNPCDEDIDKCKSGICRETVKMKNSKFLCACPPRKTGPLCEIETPDCRQCTDKGRTQCMGFPDETAFCICLKYKTKQKILAPSICFFYNKAKPDRQWLCGKENTCSPDRQWLCGKENTCSPGEQCVNYAQDGKEVAQVCQCPVGNTRGRNCEEDYAVDHPGEAYSCVDTNQIGPICMCKKYGENTQGERGEIILNGYGFCKPPILKATLIDALIDNGPCSLDKNKCRNGECIMKNENNSFCACANKSTGKYCHFDMPHCNTCKDKKRKECLSLDDGSAMCICWEYTTWKIKAPSICYFPKAKDDRQTDCGKGLHNCDRGEKCVNYGQVQGEKHQLCVCPAGKTRGKNCIEDFKFIDVPDDGKTECVYTGAFGAFCMCNQYGSSGNDPGFCKPIIKVHGAVVKPKGSGGPCDISNNKCHRGVCTETPLFEGWDFLCACPRPWTGEFCHYEMLHCSKCKTYAQIDCISLPDDTAVCVCVELDNVKDRQPPLICRFDKAKRDRQASCKTGKHNCDIGQKCVDYSQTGNSVQGTCTCPAGKKRGKRCKEEFGTSLPRGKFHCFNTILTGTLCVCDVYGQGQDKYGFCVPQQKELKGDQLAEHIGNPVTQNESPCDTSHNICREGTCLETTGSEKPGFVCSCPTQSTGTLCHEDKVECQVCQVNGLRDCIGLPDGTGICVCVEFNTKEIHRQLPAICSWKKALQHRQIDCNKRFNTCNRGQTCVNYAQVDKVTQLTCQCAAGGKRGKNCQDDYQIDNLVGIWPCVDTQGYGPICLCDKYGRGIEQYGFCKPQLADSGVKRLSKRNEPSTWSSELYAVESFSRRSLLAVDNLKTSEMPECWQCKPSATIDCIGLSDKTAYCICTDFSFKKTDEVPAVCNFLQAIDGLQISCKRVKHNCSPKQNCVNYAQAGNEMHNRCVCPEGRFRGGNCEDEYQLIDWTNGLSCVKTVNNGPICMCNVYGKNKKEFGFCKPKGGSEGVILQPKAPPLTQQTAGGNPGILSVKAASNPFLLRTKAPDLTRKKPGMKPEITSIPADSNSRPLSTTEPISDKDNLIQALISSSNEISSKVPAETGGVQEWLKDLERAKQGTVLQSMDNITLIGIVVAVPVGLILVGVLCFCRGGSSEEVKEDKKVTSKRKSRKRERTDETKDRTEKKKRKKLDEVEEKTDEEETDNVIKETNAEKVDVNENSPLQGARGRRSSRVYGRLWRYPASRTSSMTKLNLSGHNNRNSPGSKQDYVRQYIKRERFDPGGFIREKYIPRNGIGTLNDADERIPLTRVNFEEKRQLYPVRHCKSTFR